MRKRISESDNLRDISILALDDDPIMTLTLQSYFQNAGYDVDTANDPEEAVEKIRNGKYDIMLLDFLMTPICGDQVVERIRKFNKELFIILLTGHKSMAPPIKTIRALDIQGYYEKSDRFDQLELLVESCVKSIQQMRIIIAQNKELTETNNRIKESYQETIRILRLTVDARDIYTRGHSDRVSYYAEKLAAFLGRNEEYLQKIRIAGMFHDVGKLNIPDSILLKEAKLTKEEFDVIKTHPVTGYNMLASVSAFKDISGIVRSHHERWDGRGYPDGLSGEDIPEESRIIAVADSFDAMTSTRRYRASRNLEFAKKEIESGKGNQFDPDIAEAFLKLLENFEDMEKDLEWTYDNKIEDDLRITK